MAIAHVHAADRFSGPEPGIALAGGAVLGGAWVLPGLWSQGINPIPPCIFHLVTGQPCPFCGGTRSFVAMAHGNLGAAAHVYPIGPLLFAGAIIAVLLAAWTILSGRRLRLELSTGAKRTLLVAGAAVLALNWAAKLLFLGY
jgi:hypothetical protein